MGDGTIVLDEDGGMADCLAGHIGHVYLEHDQGTNKYYIWDNRTSEVAPVLDPPHSEKWVMDGQAPPGYPTYNYISSESESHWDIVVLTFWELVSTSNTISMLAAVCPSYSPSNAAGAYMFGPRLRPLHPQCMICGRLSFVCVSSAFCLAIAPYACFGLLIIVFMSLPYGPLSLVVCSWNSVFGPWLTYCVFDL